jgi:hypothetical protein
MYRLSEVTARLNKPRRFCFCCLDRLMSKHDAFSTAQERRWMRPNAHLYVRADAWRFMPPGAPKYLGKNAVRYFWPQDAYIAARAVGRQASVVQAGMTPDEVAAHRAELLDLKALIAELRWQLELWRFARKALHPHHSQFQPRVPAGNPDGGQFAPGGTQQVRLAQSDSKLPGIGGPGGGFGGHHYVPKGVFKKYPLSDEARKVFNRTTSGRLETQAIGALRGHFWDGPNGAHKAYNDAIDELFRQFLDTNGIRPERMTAEEATSFLEKIERSENPRIRDYNNVIRLLRMLRLFRGRE